MANATNSCPTELPAFCQQRHWSIYWIIIACSLIVVGGRVLTVQNFNASGETCFHSANDRSRWATVRSLVDEGTYRIDNVIQGGQAINWHTIDQVRHLGEDGQLHAYSSKPTLLPTMVAGVYWCLKKLTGWEITERTLLVPRLVLLFTNVIPWGVFLFFLAKLIDRVPVRDWSRYLVLGVAGFGTYLTTFSVTLNNHVPAAVCVTVASYFLCRIWWKQRSDVVCFFVCGVMAALAVAFELPALAFAAVCGFSCLLRSVKGSLLGFVPGAVLVAVGLLGTNYLAHGEWKPAYGHRSDGDLIATVNGDFESVLDEGQLPVEFEEALPETLQFRVSQVARGDWPTLAESTNRWVVGNRSNGLRFAIVQAKASKAFEIREWGNWYEYPESYWLASRLETKSEVDRGQEDRLLYAFHVLFGHHGVFSLTPVWMLSFAGMVCLLFQKRLPLRWFGLFTIAITAAVFVFYVGVRPAMDRNYGGVTSALRWVFWLAPLWLVCMLPIVEWMGRTPRGRWVCVLLLLVSGLSAFYSVQNPWVHPWLYEVWEITGVPR